VRFTAATLSAADAAAIAANAGKGAHGAGPSFSANSMVSTNSSSSANGPSNNPASAPSSSSAAASSLSAALESVESTQARKALSALHGLRDGFLSVFVSLFYKYRLFWKDEALVRSGAPTVGGVLHALQARSKEEADYLAAVAVELGLVAPQVDADGSAAGGAAASGGDSAGLAPLPLLKPLFAASPAGGAVSTSGAAGGAIGGGVGGGGGGSVTSVSGAVPAPGAHMGGAASLLSSPLSIRSFLSASKQSNQTFLQNFILRTRIFKAFIYARANCLGAIIALPHLQGEEGRMTRKRLLLTAAGMNPAAAAAAVSNAHGAAGTSGSAAGSASQQLALISGVNGSGSVIGSHHQTALASYSVSPNYLFDALCVAKLRSKLLHLQLRSLQSHVCSHAHAVQFWHGPLSARKAGRFQKRYLALVGRRLMVYKVPLGLLVTNQAALDADPSGDTEPDYVLWEREKGDTGDEGSATAAAQPAHQHVQTPGGSVSAAAVAAGGGLPFSPTSSPVGQPLGPQPTSVFSPSSSPPVVHLAASVSPTSSAAAIASLVSSRRPLLSTKPPKYLRILKPGVVQLVQPVLMDVGGFGGPVAGGGAGGSGGRASSSGGSSGPVSLSASASDGEGTAFFTFQLIQHPLNTKDKLESWWIRCDTEQQARLWMKLIEARIMDTDLRALYNKFA